MCLKMEALTVIDILKAPLNQAHLEERNASRILSKDSQNFVSAIECHQRAHGYLRSVQLTIPPAALHRASVLDNCILTSLYSQMDHHLLQQSRLLNRQRRSIIELKRQSYVEAVREKAAALTIINTMCQRTKIQQQLSHQETLISKLKNSLSEPDTPEAAPSDPLSTTTLMQSTDHDTVSTTTELSAPDSFGVSHENDSRRSHGKKKPKSASDTLEELNGLNEQFRQCINELVNENIQLKKDLATYHHAVNHKGSPSPLTALVIEDSVETTDQSNLLANRSDTHIYSLPDALALAPLELPPEVNLPEEEEDNELFPDQGTARFAQTN